VTRVTAGAGSSIAEISNRHPSPQIRHEWRWHGSRYHLGRPRWLTFQSLEGSHAHPTKESPMFILLAIILAALWIGGFTVMHVTSFAIHILLVLAVISIIMHFVRGGRSRTV
jgi:hypothetical protein